MFRDDTRLRVSRQGGENSAFAHARMIPVTLENSFVGEAHMLSCGFDCQVACVSACLINFM